MPIVENLRFREHPIEYLHRCLLKVLIGKRPVVVNVTIRTIPEDPQGALMYWPWYVKRPVVYNINLIETRRNYPHDALITSNPE